MITSRRIRRCRRRRRCVWPSAPRPHGCTVVHGKNMDSTAVRGKIDGKARGKKRHKARLKAKRTRRRAGWSAPPWRRGDDHDGLIGLDTKRLVDHFSSDADSLSPGERFRISATRAVLDGIELRCIALDAAVGSAMRRARLGSLQSRFRALAGWR